MTKTTFEEALRQLEKIVQELESGDPPLESAIKKFEVGMRLARYCNDKLDETEKRITVLMEKGDGESEEVPLDPDATEADDGIIEL